MSLLIREITIKQHSMVMRAPQAPILASLKKSNSFTASLLSQPLHEQLEIPRPQCRHALTRHPRQMIIVIRQRDERVHRPERRLMDHTDRPLPRSLQEAPDALPTRDSNGEVVMRLPNLETHPPFSQRGASLRHPPV